MAKLAYPSMILSPSSFWIPIASSAQATASAHELCWRLFGLWPSKRPVFFPVQFLNFWSSEHFLKLSFKKERNNWHQQIKTSHLQPPRLGSQVSSTSEGRHLCQGLQDQASPLLGLVGRVGNRQDRLTWIEMPRLQDANWDNLADMHSKTKETNQQANQQTNLLTMWLSNYTTILIYSVWLSPT